jgi:hypothetical protein
MGLACYGQPEKTAKIKIGWGIAVEVKVKST